MDEKSLVRKGAGQEVCVQLLVCHPLPGRLSSAIALGHVLASRLWNNGVNIALSSQALQRLGTLSCTSQLATTLMLL